MNWTLDRVTVTYRLPDGTRIDALRYVSLAIQPGERLAIVGANGSGKSALALGLAGLITPTAGQIALPEGDSQAGSDNPNWAALVFQNPDDNLIARTVTEEIALTLEHAVSPGEPKNAVDDVLGQFHIAHLADRAVARLSGGEKQALALACAFASRRRLIVLDEPTSHLDPPSRRGLLRLLTDPASWEQLTIVLITQYAEEARQFARIVHLEDGIVVYDGPGDGWTPSPRPSGRIFVSTEVIPSSSPPIITTTSLCQREQPGWPLPPSPLTNISVTVNPGDAVGLSGPIGSGKSTLAFHLAGLIPAPSGTVTRESGRNLPVVLIQFPERQLFCPTILDDVIWGPVQKGVAKHAARATATQLLDRLQLPVAEFATRSPFALSGGQRRRAALAGAAACQAPLYILDEPTAALDAPGMRRLEDLLQDWHSTRTAFVIISHDLNWLARVTTRLWVMDAGEIQFDGLWSDSITLPPLLERLGFAPVQGE